MTLARDYTLAEVAEALQMSERWVRQQVAEGAAHQRYGNRLRFTAAQVDALRARFTRTSAEIPIRGITTRRLSPHREQHPHVPARGLSGDVV